MVGAHRAPGMIAIQSGQGMSLPVMMIWCELLCREKDYKTSVSNIFGSESIMHEIWLDVQHIFGAILIWCIQKNTAVSREWFH